MDITSNGTRQGGIHDKGVCRMHPVDSDVDMLYGLKDKFPERTYYLGQVFRNTTNSYKLLWFMAILSILKRKDQIEITMKEIFIEMLSLAWHPVCFYRLSLGKQDKLQDAVLTIQAQSNLPLDASAATIRESIAQDYKNNNILKFLGQYVPMRFLSPWFSEQLRGKKDHEKNSLINILARQSQESAVPTPYYLDESLTFIRLNQSWKNFLIENLGVIQAFVDFHFARYLQTRNPNVPGIIYKLRVPTKRQLSAARRFWNFVRNEFYTRGWEKTFKDIYSLSPLYENFSIDHFLPWSFVVHDSLWNLTPVEKSTNSMKSDKLPNLKIYLPRLAELHYKAIEVSINRPKLLEDYVICFKEEPNKILSLGEKGLQKKYYQIIEPQAQIAINQGFQHDWEYV